MDSKSSLGRRTGDEETLYKVQEVLKDVPHPACILVSSTNTTLLGRC